MRFRGVLALLLAVSTAAVAGGCATYREDLNRGERLYESNEYARALAIWRVLEEDMDSLTWEDQARYAYLRGMTDYRLGPQYRADARHWLAIAKAINEKQPNSLQPQWKERLEQALDDLNRDVFGGAEAMRSESQGTETKKDLVEEPLAPGKCRTNDDCPQGNTCQAQECVVL
ncbi:MAG: hypothetical protein KF718_19250 [Polyangiaceae bacterium]|nr:hypothetical protein [Polyangiaceae bacterium]